MKKALSLIISLLVVLSAFYIIPLSVSAEEIATTTGEPTMYSHSSSWWRSEEGKAAYQTFRKASVYLDYITELGVQNEVGFAACDHVNYYLNLDTESENYKRMVNLVNNLTKDCNNTYEKAVAIQEYVFMHMRYPVYLSWNQTHGNQVEEFEATSEAGTYAHGEPTRIKEYNIDVNETIERVYEDLGYNYDREVHFNCVCSMCSDVSTALLTVAGIPNMYAGGVVMGNSHAWNYVYVDDGTGPKWTCYDAYQNNSGKKTLNTVAGGWVDELNFYYHGFIMRLTTDSYYSKRLESDHGFIQADYRLNRSYGKRQDIPWLNYRGEHFINEKQIIVPEFVDKLLENTDHGSSTCDQTLADMKYSSVLKCKNIKLIENAYNYIRRYSNALPDPTKTRYFSIDRLICNPYNENGELEPDADGYYCIYKHTPVFNEGKPVTCSTDEVATGYYCSRCHERLSGYEVYEVQPNTTGYFAITPKLADGVSHVYDNWTTTKESTCTEAGTEISTCTECGKEVSRAKALKDHTLTFLNKSNANNPFNIDVYYCSECGYYWNSETAIEKIQSRESVPLCTTGTPSAPYCGHKSVEHFAAQGATCGNDGNIEYWHCTTCDRYFADANFTNEIQENSWITSIPHNMSVIKGTDATCTENGSITYYKCSKCNKIFKDNNGEQEISDLSETIIPAKGHSLTHYEKTEPTCIQQGNIEYWYCEDCNKYFANKNATQTLSNEQIYIQPTGEHKWDKGTVETEATCTQDGEKVYCCTKCSAQKTEKIPKLGHSLVSVDRVIATCQHAGNIQYEKCTTCGLILVNGKKSSIDDVTTAKLEHTPVVINKKTATYFNAGYTGDKYCVCCGEFLSYGKTTKKTRLSKPEVYLKGNKKAIRVKYYKVKNATGFEVRYKISGKWKTKTFNTTKTTAKMIKKLKKNKKYLVQVRAFIKQNGKIAYSSWTEQKTIKVL